MQQSTTPVILDDAAVQAMLPRLDVRKSLRDMFAALAESEAVQPPQSVTLFPGGGGDFITYLGAVEAMGVFGAKLSPYIVTEAAPIITAWTALMSMKTGQPLVWCDAASLTTERTAGTTALAVDLLLPQEATRLAIIGSGPIAQAHLRHVARLRNWEQVRVHSPALADEAEKQVLWQGLSDKVAFAPDAANCVEGADLVMLCTSSGTPVIAPEAIGKPALITSISTNAPDAHEVPPEFLCTADVYCDYAPTCPGAAADMRLAAADHGWSADRIKGDLAGLVSGNALLPDYERPVYFRSVGLGLEDIAMAHGIWELSQARQG